MYLYYLRKNVSVMPIWRRNPPSNASIMLLLKTPKNTGVFRSSYNHYNATYNASIIRPGLMMNQYSRAYLQIQLVEMGYKNLRMGGGGLVGGFIASISTMAHRTEP